MSSAAASSPKKVSFQEAAKQHDTAAASTAAPAEAEVPPAEHSAADSSKPEQPVTQSAVHLAPVATSPTCSTPQEISPNLRIVRDRRKAEPQEDPDRRDRLRKVEVKKRTLTIFQKYVLAPLVDFIMWAIVNVFFREVSVVGLENVPKAGPVIFYGNHQNQFMDGMMIRAHCGRSVRFIVAEKSMHRPIIGHFAMLMESVPVVRPQDVPNVSGEGKLVMAEGTEVKGEGTKFASILSEGDVITWRLPGNKEKSSAQIVRVRSDTNVVLSMPVKEEDRITQPTPFKYSRRIDHSEMYAEVYHTLAKGGCIGIFPEGGSHDRTSLLPLKAGVALFTLGAAERGIDVKMVPCGLTYFYGHKFRSRAHIEFGKPLEPSAECIEQFRTAKRDAVGSLLKTLDSSLRSVTINVPDWASLKFLHAFRRLYHPPHIILETRDYLRLARRLAVLIMDHDADPKFADFRIKVENYLDYCNALLIRDSQVATLERLGEESLTMGGKLLARRIGMIIFLGVVLIPFCIISVPVGILASVLAEAHAKTALAESSVKVVAADVKASHKIVIGFVLVPLTYVLFSILVFLWSDLRTALTVLFSLPMAMYVSLLIIQEFVLELHATLPLLMSILSKHKQFLRLFERRRTLVSMAKEIVTMYDPQLNAELECYASIVQENTLRQPSLFSLRHASRHIDKLQ